MFDGINNPTNTVVPPNAEHYSFKYHTKDGGYAKVCIRALNVRDAIRVRNNYMRKHPNLHGDRKVSTPIPVNGYSSEG